MTLLRDISTMWASTFSLVLFFLLFESRYSVKKTATLTLTAMLPLLLVNFVLLFLLGPAKMGILILFTCSLPSLIFFWFLAKHRDGRFFFTFCLADTLILEIIHITSILDFYLGNTYLFMLLSRLILCPLLALFICKRVCPVYREMQDTIQKGWYALAAISMIFYVVLSLSMSHPTVITQRPEYLPAYILLLILMPVVYNYIFDTLRNQRTTFEISEKDHILELQISGLTTRMEALSATENKHRMERHDFHHKLNIIASLAEKQQYDDLSRLLAEYTEAMKERQGKRYCSNAVLDAVLSFYLQEAERQGIKVTTAIAFPPVLPVGDAELATVFANAIENAICACQPLEESQRTLEIKVLIKPRFMFQISNSFNGDVTFDKKGIPISRRDGHGYGTQSIAAFCEKNHAFYEFKADHRTFSLRIMF